MSLAAVAPTSIYQEIQAFSHQRGSDLSQLKNDLQSGNANAALQDFNAIVTLGQSGPFANGAPFRNSQREQDFVAIGQSLQSGDLNGAQQAFSQLLSTFRSQSSPPQNQQPQANPASPPAAEIVINLGGSASANTTNGATPSNNLASSGSDIVINLNNKPNTLEEITLTLSNNGNGTEQLNISASQGNQSPEQFTLNFNQNSNEQIVLNLLNSSSTPTSATQNSAPQSNGLNVVA
jgi:hypothetical protein